MEHATRTSQRMDRDDVARPSPPPEVDIAVTEESKWIGCPRERLTLDIDWGR